MPVDANGRFFQGGKPIRVDGGIAVRAKRGKIGEQWWSRRFVDILERICDGGRLSRGRSYARKGQVMGFDVLPGRVRGQVQGSRTKPYQVTITIAAYDDSDWARIEQALASQALFRAALLAGEMPHEIVDVFDSLDRPLFPSRLDMKCSCPDWSVPCKHASAVLYVLAFEPPARAPHPHQRTAGVAAARSRRPADPRPPHTARRPAQARLSRSGAGVTPRPP